MKKVTITFKNISFGFILFLCGCAIQYQPQQVLPDWATNPRPEISGFSGIGVADNLDEALGLSLAELAIFATSHHTYYSQMQETGERSRTRIAQIVVSRYSLGSTMILSRITNLMENIGGEEVRDVVSLAYIIEYRQGGKHYSIESYTEENLFGSRSGTWKEVRSINVIEDGFERSDLMRYLGENGLLLETARDKNKHYVLVQLNDSLLNVIKSASKAQDNSISEESPDTLVLTWADSIESTFDEVFGDLLSLDSEDIRRMKDEPFTVQVDSTEQTEESTPMREKIVWDGYLQELQEKIGEYLRNQDKINQNSEDE